MRQTRKVKEGPGEGFGPEEAEAGAEVDSAEEVVAAGLAGAGRGSATASVFQFQPGIC